MLMLIFVVAAAIILPIMWVDRTYHDMIDIGWLDPSKPLPWKWIAAGLAILVLLIAID